MSRIKLKENDKIEQLRRFIAYRLSAKHGFGTLVFDPHGDSLIFILDIAEREFGRGARDELFEFLAPYHKMRVLKTLQQEGVKQKLWMAATDLADREDLNELFEGEVVDFE
ncbi:TPA_asm: hypothetical protein GacPV1_gp06 [Geoglobus acetivorans pleomorphic virus 1]|uniref:Uncharacterized protein n=2 Tax=root TaxID=1 RepID=A0A0A7GHN1_GEOAI|nr:hypothetical protein GACE_1428 [Geoglobus acetivorans]